MEWCEYCEDAVKTAPEQPRSDQLSQAALGLAGEIGEIEEAGDQSSAAEECGDAFWYLALACDAVDARDIHMEGRAGVDAEGLKGATFALCEATESFLHQKDASARHDVERCLWSIYIRLCQCCPGNPPDIWASNIDKLRDRHGDSFSPADEQSR